MGFKMYILICVAVTIIQIPIICQTRSVNNNNKEERECDLLLKRLKRDTGSNVFEDDDVFIENLIKSTLSREKQKCIDKFHLLEMPPQAKHDDSDDAMELRREVAKLKDLVDVIKDQRYILRTLENVPKNVDTVVNHSKTLTEEAMKAKEIETLRNQMRKLQNQLKNQQILDTGDIGRITDTVNSEKSDLVKNALDKQQGEINNLKNLLQGILLEMKTARRQEVTTTETPHIPKAKDMTKMLAELSTLEKQLSKLQRNSSSLSSEIVAMKPPIETPPLSLESSLGSTQNHMQGRSASPSERAAEEELDTLLNLLAPEKSSSSINSLLKSLDSDSDLELERRLQNLEKEVKHKKKKQLEKKLKNLESQLTQGSIQSKSDDNDLGDNAELKRLLVKLLKKKKVESESKTLGDDEILDELKSLQKSIKNLSTDDDDDLFDDLEEKNGSLDVTLEKLINAGGSSTTTSHRKRKLTDTQIKAIRRRIMAMKQGNAMGENYGDEGNFDMNGGHGDNYDHWYGGSGTNGHSYDAIHFHGTYGGPGLNYNHEELPYGSGLGGDKHGNPYINPDHFYGQSGYANLPTNQFGTPVYSNYGNNPSSYPGFLPNSYTSNQGIGQTSSYGPSKYFNGNPAYASSNLGPSGSYSPTPSGHYPNPLDYKPFFPASQENPGSSYSQNTNSGKPSQAEQYQNQHTSANYGSGSVADLKKQIYDLQGVINTFSKPEYVQKPEDEATVYNLNQQINELKSVVNNLQEQPYAAANAGFHAETSYQAPPSYQQPAVVYESVPVPVPQVPHPEPVIEPHSPQPQPQPQPAPSPVYAPQPQPNVEPAQAEYQHASAARNYDGHYRHRRGIDVHSAIHRNQDAINTLGALLGDILGIYEDNNETEDQFEWGQGVTGGQEREATDRTPHVFDDINAKIADVRKQLDHRMLQQQRKQHHPIALLQELSVHPRFPQPHLLRNNDYNQYPAYNVDNYGYEEEKSKSKKESKSPDLFDKIFDKILDKIMKKLIKAFPKIIGAIFGNLFDIEKNKAYDTGYKNNYDVNYQHEDHDLADTFQGMGIFGIIPMIIVKLLSKIHYIFQYLQRYKFFKTFLVPGLVLLLSAGAIIFLVYWMQPNEENEYKKLDYENYDDGYRSTNSNAYYSQKPTIGPPSPYRRNNDVPGTINTERRNQNSIMLNNKNGYYSHVPSMGRDYSDGNNVKRWINTGDPNEYSISQYQQIPMIHNSNLPRRPENY